MTPSPGICSGEGGYSVRTPDTLPDTSNLSMVAWGWTFSYLLIGHHWSERIGMSLIRERARFRGLSLVHMVQLKEPFSSTESDGRYQLEEAADINDGNIVSGIRTIPTGISTFP